MVAPMEDSLGTVARAMVGAETVMAAVETEMAAVETDYPGPTPTRPTRAGRTRP